MNNEIISPRRRVVATMHRAQSKDVIMVRHYAYFDTAMPRMLQLAMSYCNEGDFVEFTSAEYGWSLGLLRIKKGGKFEVTMTDMVKNSPSLLKLMSEDSDYMSRYL